ncbi:MAG: CRISPR-associated helicase Cas3' [Levilactobacillus sp.]|jgi:CRISPR-associated endonuclease/helicase Cas3|uniref:CRISPR-associated helicase Cas3' n=1 Tax=Levilactobacillus sp. TaxID=2767919 RepID=UPI002587CFD4|nr:CRISPR-associated helicase Cas3' [Levilactobacillus sp.]MCH4124188.1 CRISPR-associated helicase Cas3' [Levilactobacillus sp.]MCI1554527.1 CRISPR-associated helicase Cas3' [Levilactobacillus sp.]MCI1598368.1 CRISPR-associated helicase Cas3' [Levilactobacillus sp.]MCI1605848.1 CRISPR-associated helicase Cas3' [Levilactobacillus sp.]
MAVEISKRAAALWAKKRSEDGQQAWLPLIVHLLDTQNVANYLFNQWLSPGQRRLLQGSLSATESQRLVKLVGFFHDFGKISAAFQAKESYNRDKSLDEYLRAKLTQVGFVDFDSLYLRLSSTKESPHALAGEAILEGLGVPDSIGAIIGGHHGKPADYPPDDQIGNYTANYYLDDIRPEIQQPWQDVQQELFDYGLKSAGYQTVKDIPNITQPQAVILEGLLIMADWLASSEHLDDDQQTPLFPLIPLDCAWPKEGIKTRFQKAMTAWDAGGEWYPQQVALTDSDPDPYQERWGFKPRPVQKAMTQAIGATLDPGMVIIEAPMGIGKTEIALLAVEQLANITGRDGLFMGLPTQATTDAMFDRVDDWLAFLARQQAENLQIRLMHGKSQFNQTYRALPNATNIYDDDGAGQVVVNGWFSGKKSILTKFTVGTIDNLLLLSLKQKHLFLRHLGFSGKVVVIDEAHAFDVFMDQFLYKALRWLGVYHVPIVILSATLPKAKRNQLLDAYLKGKYGRHYELDAPKDWEDTQAYPLLSLLDGHHLKQVTTFPGQSDQQPTKLQVQRLNVADEELVVHVVNQLVGGGVAGVIVNTVKRAQTLAEKMPAEIPTMILHSAFLATDRTVQANRLQAAIGKHGQRPDKLVVIGTQVLEQSLDIDFDVLYTDIAPMDLILQRAGRLHRHQIARPQALEVPQVFVMGIAGPGDYGEANEAIYSKYLLMKTDHFLQDTIALPDDISPLVQAVYDSATDDDVPDIADAKDEFENHLKAEKRKARVYQIANPKTTADATIHGWLERNLGDVTQNEQKAAAAVRDIKETLEVILVQHTDAGDFLLDGQRLSEAPSQKIAQQVIHLPIAVTPNIDEAIKRLETLTGHYFSGWQSDVWLRGALALPLDENLAISFAGWQLTYSAKVGLKYVKEGDIGG